MFIYIEQLEKLLLKFGLDHTVAGAAIDTMEKVSNILYLYIATYIHI